MLSKTRKLLSIIFIALLVLLSSVKLLDDYVDDYTTEAITQAAVTYATARGLNALVSMIQSSNISAGIGIVSGSMSIGELLDPINDMLERFSSVMTLVLASLAAQKILLLIASHQLFIVALAILGLVTVTAIVFARPGLQNLLFKSFLVLAFIRFCLAIAVGLNSGVDHLFLEEATRENDQRIERFQENLLEINTTEMTDPESLKQSSINFWKNLNLEELNRRVTDGIENFINLVAIYLLKTILFPLLFFYLTLQTIKTLWRVEFIQQGWTPAGADR